MAFARIHNPVRRIGAFGIALLLGACALQAPAPAGPGADEPAPQATACPAGLPATVRCLGGRDRAGAFYLIAMPADWNGRLVVHAHGGPFLGAPTAKRIEDDLTRWAIVPRAGYAWAGSSFHQGGVAVRSAAEDTERVRGLFIRHVAKPKLTLLHGQSWGASVAAKGAETYTAGQPYDGLLLTSGVLAGGTRAYDMRLDLREVYQVLCRNHPRPDEAAYPLWMGLPEGSTMTTAELAKRADECLGLGRPAAQRTPEQAQKLKTIVDVLHIPERAVMGHLNWATFHFQDIARRSGGKPVFGNVDARYRGSADDATLNAAVARTATDAAALARFADDTDPTGRIPVPVLTVHGIHDPTAFVEMQHTFAQTMAAAGRGDALVQTFTDDHEHSYLSDATYVALLDALVRWVETGAKPTPQQVSDGCRRAQAAFPSSCRFVPDYRPSPLDTRVTPRRRS
ncbi:alpha/beta hydrolase [Aquabacterium humicola]|uniref:alpha/beta hydrolase n=1 Tax=Aquabacterium humicola TaxID=3237377 RepID=UPI002543D552|nr:alpha/beta hydrolase [Rubrivivax pictus]